MILPLQIFLEISGDWSQPTPDKPLKQSDIEVWSGSINHQQDWSPNLCQLKAGMDLHSLVNLRKAFSCLTGEGSRHLEEYQHVAMSELKVWFDGESGDVVVYFPVSIAMSFSDVYHVGTGRIHENRFARYVQAAAARNFGEFETWLKGEQFQMKTLKLFGHSRGAAVADLFCFLGKKLWGQICVTLVRAAPLASLGRDEQVVFENVEVKNVVLVGEMFRDPYTRCQPNFKHPEDGPSTFLHVKL